MRRFRRHDSQVLDWQRRCNDNSGEASTRGSIGLDRFMQRARAQSFWTQCEYVLPLVGDDLTAARTPLRADYGNDPITNNGFVSGDYGETTGLSGNSGDYLDAGFVCSSQLTTNDSHGAAYTDKASNAATLIFGAATGTTTAFYLYPRWSDGNTYTDHCNRYSGQGRTVHADSMSGGFYVANRDSSTTGQLYKGNGSTSFASAATMTSPTGSMPATYNLYLMGGNELGSAGNYFLDDAMWFSFGTSFTSTEAGDYFDAVQEFQEFLGRSS